MQVEAGKYYRTRDGRKAYVYGVADNPLGTGLKYSLRGFIGHEHTGWTPDGTCCHKPIGADLVEEWKEPKKVKRKACLVRSQHSDRLYLTFDAPSFDETLLGESWVEITEGDGIPKPPLTNQYFVSDYSPYKSFF